MSGMLETLAEIAGLAAAEILRVRRAGFAVEYKADASPVTLADRAAHACIARELAARFPDIPQLSEEGRDIPFAERRAWQRFFLVDPLDGTKEFVKDLGEFCVCIALVEGRYPAAGVVCLPARGLTYLGGLGLGAFRRAGEGPLAPIRSRPADPKLGFRVAESRSHPDERLDAYLSTLRVRERIVAGSALKFCLLAEGSADLYARCNPTHEWDTAAGQAVLEGAGGSVTDWQGQRLACNTETLLNPGFLARG